MLDHKIILDEFENVRVGRTDSKRYIFSDKSGNDFFEIYILDDGSYHFVIDNALQTRVVYHTNIPYGDIKDLLADIKRMGIMLQQKNFCRTTLKRSIGV